MKRYRGDIYGGLTSAVIALPLALAFGVASGAGPLAGLYGAILLGFFAAVFGGTPAQISGPTGPMTVVMAGAIAHFANNPSLAFFAVVLAGAMQVGFGLAGIGRYIKLVPQPVVSGFMSGIGAIIIILQLAPMLGHTYPTGEILVKLAALPVMLASINLQALMLTLATLAVMVFYPQRLSAILPAPLLATILGTLAGMLVLTDVQVIGAIPKGLPEFQLPNVGLADVPVLIRFAAVLAFLGSIDSLLTSLVADNLTENYHHSNRELIGQGIGNMAAGLFGGLAGAGATMRTLANVRAGGSGPVSGALHAVVLLILVLGFSDIAGHIPLAVLAGILLKIGIDIIDWRYLGRIHSAPRAGVIIMLTTLFITVFVDLMTAVSVGIVMASLLFVARMADAQMKSARLAFGADQLPDLKPEEIAILEAAARRIVLFHVEGPLSFGSARDFAKLLQPSDEVDALLIDLTNVPFIDSSASMALEDVILKLQQLDDTVIIFGGRPPVMETLRKTGVLDLLEPGQLASTRLEALQQARIYIEMDK